MTMRLNQSQVSGIPSPYSLAAEERLWQGTLMCVGYFSSMFSWWPHFV